MKMAANLMRQVASVLLRPARGKEHSIMKDVYRRLVRNEAGQDLIEYVLIGSFVSIAVMAAATALGLSLTNWYNGVALWVQNAADLITP